MHSRVTVNLAINSSMVIIIRTIMVVVNIMAVNIVAANRLVVIKVV